MAQQLAVMVPLLGLSVVGVGLLLHHLRKKKTRADFFAFVGTVQIEPPPAPPPPAAPPPLTGFTFAVKDNIDIEGEVTGFGSTAWAATHPPAAFTAPCVTDLVNQGATCVAKTAMDEFAYSIFGASKTYPTPCNPSAPHCFPGGSSSGSAVAVAAGLVDFALGTDTAGSIRVPAAFCGVVGYRPSHAAVSSQGTVPMAPSLDTIGVLARDAKLVHSVAHFLLHLPFMTPRVPLRLLIADDLFSLSATPRQLLLEPIVAVTERHLGPIVRYTKLAKAILERVPSLQHFTSSTNPPPASSSSSPAASEEEQKVSQALAPLAEAMKILQRYEFKAMHEDWFAAEQPAVLQDDVSSRVQLALSQGSVDEASAATRVREELRGALNDILKNDTLLVLPTVPSTAPRLNSKPSELDSFRSSSMLLLSIASMAGCPQVSLPCGSMIHGKSTGAPISISLLSRHGTDRFLLDALCLLAPAVAEEAKVVAEKFKKGMAFTGSKASEAAAAAAQPSPAEQAKEKGNTAYKEKRYNEAVDFYSLAIKLDPSNATYFNNRAMAHLQLCNFQQVESDCSHALKLDKKNVKAMLRRGTAREFLGCYAEALEDFRQALVFEPTNRTAHQAVERLESSGLV